MILLSFLKLEMSHIKCLRVCQRGKNLEGGRDSAQCFHSCDMMGGQVSRESEPMQGAVRDAGVWRWAEWKASRERQSSHIHVFISGWRDHQSAMGTHCKEANRLCSETKAFVPPCAAVSSTNSSHKDGPHRSLWAVVFFCKDTLLEIQWRKNLSTDDW